MANYFATPDDKGQPVILYRLNDDTMKEEIFIEKDLAWKPAHFLGDMLFGSGGTGAITENEARTAFPKEAFD